MEPDNNQPPVDNTNQPSAEQPVQTSSGAWPSASGTPEPIVQPANTPGATSQSVVPPQPGQSTVNGQASPLAPVTANSKKSKRKLFLIAGVATAIVLVVGGGAGAYFGFVVPNQPDNVWKHGLNNTATAYDKLVTSSEKRDVKKGGTFKGTYKYDSKSLVLDGSIDTKFNGVNSNTTFDVGAAGTRITANVLTTASANSKNPDVYAKVSGLAGIDKLFAASGDSSTAGIGAALAAYDNQWYLADHTLFDQAEKSATDNQTLPTDLTKEDTKAITDAVGRVNRDYIFTTDPSKAVLTKSQNIGKEQYDGRSAYHFKVGYKKDKLKAYVAAMSTELKKTKVNNLITDKDITELNASIDKLDDTKQADAWVDMNTKLIRNVRITTDASKGEYLDIGQKYNGGDEVPFSFGFTSADKEDGGTATLLVTTNMKSDDVKIKADLKITTGSTPYSITFGGTLTSSNDEVKIDKPANAKSFAELYSMFLGGTGASALDSDISGTAQ